MKTTTAGIFAGILAVVASAPAHADIATTNYVKGALQSLDATNSVTSGKYITAVNSVDGKVEITEADMVTTGLLAKEYDTTNNLKPITAGAVKEALNDVSGDMLEVSESLGDLGNTGVDGDNVASQIAKLDKIKQDKSDSTVTAETVHYIAKGEKVGANLAALDSQVYTNTGAIETLNGDDKTAGSVAKQIADAVSTINNTTNGLAGRVTAAETSIITLQSDKQDKLTTGTDGNLQGAGDVSISIGNDGVITVTGNANGAVASGDTKSVSGGTVYTAIEDAKSAAATDATTKVNALADGAVAANTTAIATLNGSGDGSVAKALSDAKSYADTQDNAVKAIIGSGYDSTNTVASAISDLETKVGGNNVSTELDKKVNKDATTNEADKLWVLGSDGKGAWATISSVNITDSAVTSAKIADGTIVDADIASGTITKTKLASGVQDSLAKADSALQKSGDIAENKLLTVNASGAVVQAAATGTCTAGEGETCIMINDGTGFKWEKIVSVYK